MKVFIESLSGKILMSRRLSPAKARKFKRAAKLAGMGEGESFVSVRDYENALGIIVRRDKSYCATCGMCGEIGQMIQDPGLLTMKQGYCPSAIGKIVYSLYQAARHK
ncbi:MAG: hypothetical protein LBL52_01010 [Rickettsiales bacterium]|jgi:hypothetical protein|nr:hypothetical protein [Rickettsiales bacterium]